MKVIASSLRKGNIVEVDGKLYAVLNAESFHPGKGTPTTQVDMRRISDGVKVAQRFKTTEQVERAELDRNRIPIHESGRNAWALHVLRGRGKNPNGEREARNSES